MPSKIGFFLERLREQLWIKPLLFCGFAVAVAIAAAAADRLPIERYVPRVGHGTVEAVLSIIAASMLGVATFAVASMVSAYASVSNNATPRAFRLVIADDVSKTALSIFVGAFIFSVVALIAIKTGYYGPSALLVVFVVTIAILAWVIFSFVRWIDKIARLGRLGTTIERIEEAAEIAIKRQRRAPSWGAPAVEPNCDRGMPIFADTIGYVQNIDLAALQAAAEKSKAVLTVDALPGTFTAPGRALVYLKKDPSRVLEDVEAEAIRKSFMIGSERTYDHDPRFGLIALSEIAGRALSPAVNDPGTAIYIIGVLVRLFARWVEPVPAPEKADATFDRIRLPGLAIEELFEDAFTAIARDGAGTIEVAVRLQKAFISLATIENPELRAAILLHSGRALARAERALEMPFEIERVRALARKVA